jgi:hypothetical protein
VATLVARQREPFRLYLESNGIFEMVRNLVTNTDDVRHPYLTPLNAQSHSGLPPAILVTNGFDPLRDVGHAYAQKLAAAGNDLTYIHNPDLTHGFPHPWGPPLSRGHAGLARWPGRGGRAGGGTVVVAFLAAAGVCRRAGPGSSWGRLRCKQCGIWRRSLLRPAGVCWSYR